MGLPSLPVLVSFVQSTLKERGFDPGPIDGEWGAHTEAAWDGFHHIAPHSSVELKWLAIARGELGTAEIAGDRDNPRIVEYHSATTLKATDDETPWCAAFVNWCLRQAGVKGTGSAMARSFLNWGNPAGTPKTGCIVVFARGAPPNGHVAFFLEEDASMIRVLGGNQGDRVSIASFPRASVLGYRLP